MTHILDIHTHKPEAETMEKAIINHRLPVDSQFVDGHYYSIGIHPWDVTAQGLEMQTDMLLKSFPNHQIVAIGEAGLDKLTEAPFSLQQHAFELQISLSEGKELPLIIHCVKAMEQVLAIKNHYRPKQPWIWHGFRGKPEQAEQLLKHGLYLSFGEHYSEEAMKIVPDDQLFLETDDSRLDIEEILRRAAEVREIEVETLRATIRKNIQKVFFKA